MRREFYMREYITLFSQFYIALKTSHSQPMHLQSYLLSTSKLAQRNYVCAIITTINSAAKIRSRISND